MLSFLTCRRLHYNKNTCSGLVFTSGSRKTERTVKKDLYFTVDRLSIVSLIEYRDQMTRPS